MRQPRRRRPRQQPLRLQALGSAAMEDAEEETAKAGGAVRARATAKGTAMANSARLQQPSRRRKRDWGRVAQVSLWQSMSEIAVHGSSAVHHEGGRSKSLSKFADSGGISSVVSSCRG